MNKHRLLHCKPTCLISDTAAWHSAYGGCRLIAVVQLLSCVSSWPHGLQHARLPCPSLSARACSNSCPLCQVWHPAILFSVTPFSCPQSFPAPGSFPVSQFFASGGHSTGTSASVFPMNVQDWFPVGLTGLISLLSKRLSKVSVFITPKFEVRPGISADQVFENLHIHS